MRKGKWKSRKGMALLALTLAFVLGLSGAGLLDTHAAGPVETEDPCRLVIDTEALFTSIKKDYAEYVLSNGTHGITYTDVMNKVALTAKVYKVAGISAGAKFTAVPAFAGAELTDGTTFDTTAGTTYISTMPFYSGWTDTVKGTIGTKYNTNLNKQPFLLQRVELMNGAYNYASDELD